MSVPPPPDPWGSQPPTGGQPGGVPPWGPAAPDALPGSRVGCRPGVRSSRGPRRLVRHRVVARGKWILAGIAALAVIAVTVVITVLVVRPDSGDDFADAGQ